MADPRATPLTSFLIALCHDPDLLAEFQSPEFSFEGWGLSEDQQRVLREGTLGDIQEKIREENETQADGGPIHAAIWIRIPRWIFGTSGDEPSAESPHESES